MKALTTCWEMGSLSITHYSFHYTSCWELGYHLLWILISYSIALWWRVLRVFYSICYENSCFWIEKHYTSILNSTVGMLATVYCFTFLCIWNWSWESSRTSWELDFFWMHYFKVPQQIQWCVKVHDGIFVPEPCHILKRVPLSRLKNCEVFSMSCLMSSCAVPEQWVRAWLAFLSSWGSLSELKCTLVLGFGFKNSQLRHPRALTASKRLATFSSKTIWLNWKALYPYRAGRSGQKRLFGILRLFLA